MNKTKTIRAKLKFLFQARYRSGCRSSKQSFKILIVWLEKMTVVMVFVATFVVVSGSDRHQFTRLQSQRTTAAHWCCRRLYTSLWSVSVSCLISMAQHSLNQSHSILTTQAWKQTLPPSDQTLYYTSASV